jgi:hypothetical protein
VRVAGRSCQAGGIPPFDGHARTVTAAASCRPRIASVSLMSPARGQVQAGKGFPPNGGPFKAGSFGPRGPAIQPRA